MLSAVPYPGAFHTLYRRACGTRSCATCTCVPLRFATHDSNRATGGPGGMSPKYFSTFCFAVAESMSPAMTIVALEGP
jgi:tagatose-1,6-bisphosphate aldolase non-catalytic subunit AgaZ/GatZ